LVCHQFFHIFQEELIEQRLDVQEVNSKVSDAIQHYKQHIEAKIEEISGRMEHCKRDQFKVRMVPIDMGVEVRGGFTRKRSPFSNIHFYEKKNWNEAREIEWKEVPVLPVSS
jgi:hypothetical protein